ncbi:hydrolase [Bacillus sp. FJAT-49736]|uniref:hydrolase n=1 Tax=Bacillus sp. FJAT-49736 TaxID=2833582 RepID=UPI001BC8E3B4|nr:hydrolase [Bacillus sp. FJAT-49736]MBS4173907.1 hydrolase [Bacillus sp. FJAT-49736]
MGSRIMHLVIANRIAERLSIEDRLPFLIGGIAPDAVTPKESSHYFIGDVTDYSRSIDYGRFLHKYHSQVENLYVLGYYTHLIADDLWLKGFYLPWLKNRMESDKEIFHLYHNDFRLLNGKILEYYGLKDSLKTMLNYFPAIIDLQEVRCKDVEEFIPFVLEDMEYKKEVINKKLNVFTFNQIVGYIETSVDKSLLNIKHIINNK